MATPMARHALAISLFLTPLLTWGPEANAHAGHSDPAMWQVCEASRLGDVCQFVGLHDNLHMGTYRRISGQLACIRNRPLQPAPTAALGGGWGPLAGASGAALLAAGLLFGWRRRRRVVLCCVLAVGCAEEQTPLSSTSTEPAPIEFAQVSLGETCGPEGIETVVVLTETAGDCAMHAAVLDGAEIDGAAIVVPADGLQLSGHVEAQAELCEAGTCVPGQVSIDVEAPDAQAPGGLWTLSVDGRTYAADFTATRCDYDALRAPVEAQLATSIAVSEVAIYQATRVPVAVGAEAATRDTPVVMGRPGLLRVFVSPAADFEARDIRAELSWDRGHGDAAVTRTVTQSVTGASLEGVRNSTFEFDLTAEDLSDTARWSVALREAAACAPSTTEASDGARTPITGMHELEAQASGELRVVLVPIQYEADGSSRLPDLSEEQLALYRETLFAQYPVTEVILDVRDPLSWSNEVDANGTGWSELLQAILQQRARDGVASDVYYYGIFQPEERLGTYCRRGCVLGLGPVAPLEEPLYRAAIGLGFSGQEAADTAAHEVGHTHGREHSPCDTTDSDPSFPYADGGIGVWGYDAISDTLKSPEVHADFMSYCEPTWVSDYTYRALFERIRYVNQTFSDFVPGPEESWRMLTVTDDASSWGGLVTLTRPPAGQSVTVTYLDAGGETIAEAQGRSARLDHLQGSLLFVPAAPAGTVAVRIDAGPELFYVAP